MGGAGRPVWASFARHVAAVVQAVMCEVVSAKEARGDSIVDIELCAKASECSGPGAGPSVAEWSEPVTL